IAGAALFAHCLSSAIALALPLTLAWAWLRTWREARSRDRTAGRTITRAAITAYVCPCVTALTVILASWHWTGRGQLGHLLAKCHSKSCRWQWEQFAELPGMWTAHFGYAFGIVAAAGLLWASLRASRRRSADHAGQVLPQRHRLRWLALWAWCGLLPLI